MQRVVINLLLRPDVAGLDEAEAVGQRGVIALGTFEGLVAQAAMAKGIAVVSRCKQMTLMVEKQAGKPLT